MKTPGRQQSDGNISIVAENARVGPNVSIPQRLQHSLSYGTTWYILCKDLGLHACKIQFIREMKLNDYLLCHTFSDWAFELMANDQQFFQKILFGVKNENSVHLVF